MRRAEPLRMVAQGTLLVRAWPARDVEKEIQVKADVDYHLQRRKLRRAQPRQARQRWMPWWPACLISAAGRCAMRSASTLRSSAARGPGSAWYEDLLSLHWSWTSCAFNPWELPRLTSCVCIWAPYMSLEMLFGFCSPLVTLEAAGLEEWGLRGPPLLQGLACLLCG